MDEPTIKEVQQAVTELRETVEKKSVDHDKVERIQAFLDTHEEKFNQPLVRAQAQAAQHAEDIKELQEKLEAAGATEAEAKARIDALELEIARAAKPVDRSYKESDEYKAYNAFVQIGLVGMDQDQKALLRSDSATEGGVLLMTEMDTEITKKIVEIDGIRSVARVRSTGSKTLVIPIRNTIPVAQYEGEAEEGPESTSTYEAETITPYRQTFTVPITQDMLQDSAFDMESEISQDSAEAFAYGEGNGFVLGTGHKQPEGFAANAVLQAAARETAASGVLDPNAIILLTGDLKVGYNPVYVMNRRTLATIRTFRGDAAAAGDQAGQYLWMPGLNGPAGNTLNGYPYILANSMPDIAGGAFSIAFGDFRRGYTIVDRTGMIIVRDEYTQKKKAIVEITMNRWNTGRVMLTEAIKLLKIKA